MIAIRRPVKIVVVSSLFLAVGAGLIAGAGYLVTMQVTGPFAPTMRHIPVDYELAAETINFNSLDGFALKGWWIPEQHPTEAQITALACSAERSSSQQTATTPSR